MMVNSGRDAGDVATDNAGEAHNRDEEAQLRAVALQNAEQILIARQHAEEELVRTKEILEQRTAELARALEGQSRLAAIVESSDDAIIGKTLDGRILSWNRAAERLYGYTAEEAIGQAIAMLIPPDRRNEERSLIERLRRGERLQHHDTVRVTRDGRRIDVSLTVSPVLGEGGRVVAASSISRDVSARRRAEGRLATQYAVTRALAESRTLADAAPRLLHAIGEHLGWAVGELWFIDRAADVLRCSELWHAPMVESPKFLARSCARAFGRGIGLPGRVWQTARPAWIHDVVHDRNFPRALVAAEEGLHAALAFPVIFSGQVLGVLEFFSLEVRAPDHDVLAMMAAIGSQIGQFVERSRAEEALRESEQRFRLMAETLPSIVWTAAPGGAVTYTNRRWQEYSGLRLADAATHLSKRFVHPHDHTHCVEAWTTALRDGTELEVEARLRRHDGVFRWFVIRAVPLRAANGRIVQWFAVTTDIDDRKRAEHTSRFLAAASRSLAELTDHETTLQRVAQLAVPAFADWCTVDIVAPDGTVRRLAVAHANPAKIDLAREIIARYPPRPSDIMGVMHVLRTGQSQLIPFVPDHLLANAAYDEDHLRTMRTLGLTSVLCVPLRTHGRPIGALTFVTAESGRAYDATDVAVAEDLADRAVIAVEHATLLATLRESERRKDEFLAMLAHELRNPLAPIRSAAQIVRAGALTSVELEWASTLIERQVSQMARLVDDLLDVSRISHGRIGLRLERTDLATVIDAAVEASRPVIEQYQHHLGITLPGERIWLDADIARLAQVISNLLNNAAKYTDPGGRIDLTATREGDSAVIAVEDNGIGIPPDMLRRVFEMFTQLAPSPDRASGGLGIGLTLVKRLVEMHGGTVEAASKGPGTGSRFIVRLPAAGVPPCAANASHGHEGIGPPRRILLVDDNRDAAESLATLLRLKGHEVYTAHDGIDAVSAAATLRPEVVLLDLGLPRLDGYEAARRIREHHGESMELIAITGWGQEEDRRRSRDAGFDHHLTKPVELNALQQLLAQARPTPA